MVDGAHALGAFARLDVPSLGCDYYVSNAHKWL
jgi:selenocysteine lyase/cysteine desulfurase